MSNKKPIAQGCPIQQNTEIWLKLAGFQLTVIMPTFQKWVLVISDKDKKQGMKIDLKVEQNAAPFHLMKAIIKSFITPQTVDEENNKKEKS